MQDQPSKKNATAVNIRIVPSARDVARSAARLFTDAAIEAINTRGQFHVALAGGSTPKLLYSMLATDEYNIHWPKVRIYFGDERCVPPDHTDSNYRMACKALLNHVKICPGRIYRIPGEPDPAKAAYAYDATLRKNFTQPDGVLDLVLLGMGDDGHTASLFPHSTALSVTDRWCVANHVESQQVWRVTMTYPILVSARKIAFLVAGSNKADAVNRVLTGEEPIETLPARGILTAADRCTWLLDQASAASLPKKNK